VGDATEVWDDEGDVMRAAVMRGGALVVDQVPEPIPGAGQILVRTLACGICGSDLHTLSHGDLMVEMSNEAARGAGADQPTMKIMDLSRDVVMGHEFAAEVIELGDNVGNSAVGDIVVSMPVAFDLAGVHPVGYSNDYPGGYGELMVLNDLLALKVPNGLDARRAALTEPMAVGLHAVNRSQVTPAHAALVLGTGPVGLAVIAALRAAGVEQIVAADFSATRRALATTMGAHAVVDPRDEPAIDAWRRLGAKGPLVIFEAVGVPGMLDAAMRDAPAGAQILVVGVCMQPDTVRPMVAIGKELNLQFVLGYDPLEFAETLRRIAEGEVDVAPMITGSVDIDAIPDAFIGLADPDAHAKILVEPTT
jgi:threonine dehydrogenase-like Zn-dependent dehydrogenase